MLISIFAKHIKKEKENYKPLFIFACWVVKRQIVNKLNKTAKAHRRNIN